jgi:hypothetical protein
MRPARRRLRKFLQHGGADCHLLSATHVASLHGLVCWILGISLVTLTYPGWVQLLLVVPIVMLICFHLSIICQVRNTPSWPRSWANFSLL